MRNQNPAQFTCTKNANRELPLVTRIGGAL